MFKVYMKDLKMLIRAIKTVPLVQIANYSLPIISDDYYNIANNKSDKHFLSLI